MQKLNYKRGIGPLAIVIIVAVVLILGGGVYYASHKSAMNQAQVEGTTNVNGSASLETSNGTLRSLLGMGKNLMCTIKEGTASSSVNGTVYMSGQMVRGDFTMQ